MGEDLNQMLQGIPPCDEGDDELHQSSFFSGETDDDDDLREDATSSPNSPPALDRTTSLPSQFDAEGSLCNLSSLTAQLPNKRGLSKYYQGKSQSFTSLSDVRCLEDLPKKEIPFGRRMKPCRSYAGGLESNQAPASSSKTRSKKASRGYCASSIASSSSSSKRPPMHVQKNLCLH